MLYTPSLSPDYCQHQPCITFLLSCCTLLHCSQIIVNANPALLSCPHVVHSFTVPRLLSMPILHYFPALMLYTPSMFPDFCQHQACITFLTSCCTLLHCSQIIVNANPALLSCPHVVHSFNVPRLLSTPTLHYFPALMLYNPSLFPDYCQHQHALLSCPHVVHSFTVPRLLSTPILHYFPALMLYTPSLFPGYCQHQPCITFLPSCCTLLHCSQINVNTNPALLSCPHVVHSFTVPRLMSTPTLHYFPALMLYTPSLFPDYCQHQPCITFLPSCCTLLHCSQINVNTNPALLSCPHVAHSFTVPSLLSTPTLHYFPALMLYTPSLFPVYCQHQPCITFLPSCCTLLHCPQIIVNTNPALLSCSHVVHSFTVPRLLSMPILHYFPVLMLYTPSLFPDYCQCQSCITFLPSCCTLLQCSQIFVNTKPALLSWPHVVHSFTVPRLLSMPILHYFPALMLYTPSMFPDYCQHQPCITFLPSCCTILHCSQIIVNTNMHYFPALMLYTLSLFPDYCQYQHALLSCPHVVHSFTVPRLLSTPILHYFPALMLYTPSLFPGYCQHQPCITFLPSCCTLLPPPPPLLRGGGGGWGVGGGWSWDGRVLASSGFESALLQVPNFGYFVYSTTRPSTFHLCSQGFFGTRKGPGIEVVYLSLPLILHPGLNPTFGWLASMFASHSCLKMLDYGIDLRINWLWNYEIIITCGPNPPPQIDSLSCFLQVNSLLLSELQQRNRRCQVVQPPSSNPVIPWSWPLALAGRCTRLATLCIL